eukprot:gb/GEZN01006492.1/.p1 GENE.gb/GEZN01006492.1/~~gb/GEZN01006492.1/.p1  ORF type:complete len:461 (-),score=46.16 gb/GEZN01006492.1/:194-1576(-)
MGDWVRLEGQGEGVRPAAVVQGDRDSPNKQADFGAGGSFIAPSLAQQGLPVAFAGPIRNAPWVGSVPRGAMFPMMPPPPPFLGPSLWSNAVFPSHAEGAITEKSNVNAPVAWRGDPPFVDCERIDNCDQEGFILGADCKKPSSLVLPENIVSDSVGAANALHTTCQAAICGVDGTLKVELAPANDSIRISFFTEPVEVGAPRRAFEGVLRAEGPLDVHDVRDAYEAFAQNAIKIHLDKLKITGVGFHVKLKEVEPEHEKGKIVANEMDMLRCEVQKLRADLQLVIRPVVYEVPAAELRSYGWEADNATSYGPDGKVPEDDMCWRGNFSGEVQALRWCGRILLKGQVSGLGPGLQVHSEKRLGNTAFSEVSLPVFRLPSAYRPRKVESFSRRILDLGAHSSDFIGGVASGEIGYRPLRRLDVLPDGFVVLICCLHVKTELCKVLRRPTRWFVNLKNIEFFP